MAKISITAILLIVTLITFQSEDSQVEAWIFHYPPKMAWPSSPKVQVGAFTNFWRDSLNNKADDEFTSELFDFWRIYKNTIEEKKEEYPQYWLLRQG